MGGQGSYTIGPGFWGFVAFFVMAIALWLLVRNMSGRLRRMAYQERQRDEAVSDRVAPVSGAPTGRSAATVDIRPPAPPGDDQPKDRAATRNGETT